MAGQQADAVDKKDLADGQEASKERRVVPRAAIHLGGIARLLPGHERRSRYCRASSGAYEN